MIELRYDTTEMAELVKNLRVFPGQLERATSKAINETLTRTRTEMVRLVRTGYAVKAGVVRKQLALKKAHHTRLVGRISGEGSPGIPLKEFARTKKTPSTKRLKSGGYRPKVGIPVLVRKDRGKLPASGVFLARMKSGHIGAFKRVGSGLGNWWSTTKGGEIREVYGPSPLKILSSDRYDEHLDDFADKTINARLEHHANLALKKIGVR